MISGRVRAEECDWGKLGRDRNIFTGKQISLHYGVSTEHAPIEEVVIMNENGEI